MEVWIQQVAGAVYPHPKALSRLSALSPYRLYPNLRSVCDKSLGELKEVHGTETYCFSGGRFEVIASGGCIGSYSALKR